MDRSSKRTRGRIDRRLSQLCRLQVTVLTLALPAVAFVVDRRIVNSIDIPKTAILELAALLLVLLEVCKGFVDRPRHDARFPLPRSISVTGSGFIGALLLATVTSSVPVVSVWGRHPRSTGLIYYLALAGVFVVASRVLDRDRVVRVAMGLAVTVTGLGVYAAVQGLGSDPLEWAEFTFGGAFATLGNPNLLAGFMATSGPVLAMCAASARGRMRGVMILGAVMTVPAVLLAGSAQGPIALGAGILGAGMTLAYQRRVQLSARFGETRLRLAGVAVAALALASGIVASGFVGQGLLERRFFYGAALGIFGDNPVFGSGVATFGVFFSRYRALGHAQLVGADTADAVHSIPLSMLIEGGALLLLGYMAFAVAVVVLLARTVRRGNNHPGILAGLAGSLVAFHVQSMVSIDNAALGLLYVVLSASVIGLARAGTPDERAKQARDPGPIARIPQGVRRGVGVLVVVMLLPAAWQVLRPYRAELAVSAAAAGSRAGDLPVALAEFDRAIALTPWVGEYYTRKAGLLQQVGQIEDAYDTAVQGVAADDGSASLPASAGLLAQLIGRQEEASSWFDLALQRDPFNPVILQAAAEQRGLAGGPAAAVDLYQRSLAVHDTDPAVWDALSLAAEAAGETDLATEASETAAQLREASEPAGAS